MTAMMAFFLVLWIISATDKNTKTIIARYFNPVKIEEPAKAQKGIHGAPQLNTDTPGEDFKDAEGEEAETRSGPVAELRGGAGARERRNRGKGEAFQARFANSSRSDEAQPNHVGRGALQRSAREPR